MPDLTERTVIAYLVRPVEGGIKSHVLALILGLDKTRFEPVLICPSDSSLYTEAEQNGYRVIPLDITGEISFSKDRRTVLNLRRILRDIRPDVLHMHSAKAGFIGRLAVLLTRRPKMVVTFHSFVFDERVGPRKRQMVSSVERMLLGVTDRIVAVSGALKAELLKMGLPEGKIAVIPNGVTFRDIPRPARNGITVGTVSRLAPQKGLDYFLRAAALIVEKNPSARFVIVGDGPLRADLESLAQELGIRECVDFLGYQHDALSIVAGFDVFVLASTSETFGITLVEALSQEVPVVASNVGGIPEIVDGSTTGLLAEPRNAEELADQVCRLLGDKELSERVARNGCEFVRSRFGADIMIERTQDLYEDLLSAGSGRGGNGSIDAA